MIKYKKNLLLALALGASSLLSAGTGTFVSYDNPRSLSLKTQYSMSNGLRGMMVWDASGDWFDDKGTPVLTQAILDELKATKGDFTIYFPDYAIYVGKTNEPGRNFHVENGIDGFDLLKDKSIRKPNIYGFEQIIKTCHDNDINVTIMYAFARPDSSTTKEATNDAEPMLYGNGKASLADTWAAFLYLAPWAGDGDEQWKSPLQGNLTSLKKIKDSYNRKKPGRVTILLSVGGWSYKERFESVAQKGNLPLLAKSCVELLSMCSPEGQFVAVGEKGKTQKADAASKVVNGLFDGVDIDWEFEGGTPKVNYEIFMNEIAKTIKGKKNPVTGKQFLLTTALQAGTDMYDNNHMVDLEMIAGLVDRLYMMTYDYNGPNFSQLTGHNAPLSGAPGQQCIQASIQGFLAAGVPAHKLHLGLAYYGHSFKNVHDQNNGLNQRFDGAPKGNFLGLFDAGAVDYRTLIGTDRALSDGRTGMMGANEFEYHWDDVCQVPYLFCKHSNFTPSLDCSSYVVPTNWQDPEVGGFKTGETLISKNVGSASASRNTPTKTASAMPTAKPPLPTRKPPLPTTKPALPTHPKPIHKHASGGGAATGIFVSYDNPQSLTLKTKYAAHHGLTGMMVWDASGDWFDANGTPVLTQAIIDELKANGKNELTIYFPNYVVYGRNFHVKNDLKGVKYGFEQIIKRCTENNINLTVMYAFGKPDNTQRNEDPATDPNYANGIASLTDIWADFQYGESKWWPEPATHKGNLHFLRDLKSQNPTMKILLSIGGWSYKERFEEVAKKGKLGLLAKTCVNLLTSCSPEGQYLCTGQNASNSNSESQVINGLFDGIDVDWEFEGGVPKRNYEMFMTEIAKEIRGKRNPATGQQYLLTTALQTGTDVYDSAHKVNLPMIAKLVDRLYMMTYDYNGPNFSQLTGHNSPLTGVAGQQCIQASIEGFVTAGVPANKLHLGVAYYGHSFSNVHDRNDGLNQPFSGGCSGGFLGLYEAGSVYYRDLIGHALHDGATGETGMNNFTFYWDDVCQNPYLFNPHSKLTALTSKPEQKGRQRLAHSKSAKKKPLAHATKSKKKNHKTRA